MYDEGLTISILSLAELYDGIYYSNNVKKYEKGLIDFLEGVSVININHEICRMFGRIRSNLRKKGEVIGNFDILIAATCLHYNLILITENKKHFGRIEGLKIFEKR